MFKPQRLSFDELVERLCAYEETSETQEIVCQMQIVRQMRIARQMRVCYNFHVTSIGSI